MDPRFNLFIEKLRDARIDRRAFVVRAAAHGASAMAIGAGLARAGVVAAQDGSPEASPVVATGNRRDDGRPASRALVLGGGGALGIAWEVGLLAGFAEGGVVFTDADLIVGTSAGSVVGAHLALGMDPADALNSVAAFGATLDAEQVKVASQALLDAMANAAASASPEQGLHDLGRLAVEATTIDEEHFLGLLAQLDGKAWPRRFACTAIDVETGTRQVWDAGSGVPLQRAVASSCSVPFILPPVTIDNRRYMDGGLRSPLNADLAAGQERVVVISCFPLSLPDGVSDPTVSARVAAQGAELNTVRDRGDALEVIEPGEEFLAISGGGANLMDAGRVGDAHQAGVRQARVDLDRIRAVWND